MFATLITFHRPGHPMTLQEFTAAAERSAPMYRGKPGLRMKAYIVDPDTGAFGGFYVWESEADFRRMWDDAAWQENVKSRYSVSPTYKRLDVALLVDNG